MTSDILFLSALKGKATERIPVWLMRQAGRYLPEYRALRAQAGSFMNLCFDPEKAAEVTLQPVRRFDMDAAILFSDILVVPHAMGQDVSFVEGEGPKLARLDIDALDTVDFEKKLQPIYETVRRVRAALSKDKALIGFAGSPWTVMCYMIEGGGGTKTFDSAQDFARNKPAEFARLTDAVCETTAAYLISQIRAGADAVQLFDSWAGLRQGQDFIDHVIAPTEKIVAAVRAACPDTPIIGFPRSGGDLEKFSIMTRVDAIGLDQQTPFSAAPGNICVQGNLSPEILLAGGDEMTKEIARILDDAGDRPFIFNLGHGIIKETPPEHVAQLVQQVHGFRR